MNPAIDRVLRECGVRPTLFDVGASGAPPDVWNDLAPHSVYVGFDPDRRELHEVKDGTYAKATIVNQAVTADPAAAEVHFYLTRSPYCSSTLPPDVPALSNYIFEGLFHVEREATVPATTLNDVLKRLGMDSIDWLKVDSQGTDLSLFNSIDEPVRSRTLAVDVEPGLIDAYAGEDMFTDAHRSLTEQGFWLSDLTVKGTVRLRAAGVEGLRRAVGGPAAEDARAWYNHLERSLKRTPCWCEARYLRRPGWLADHQLGEREHVLLWVFALVDGQAGFAWDVAQDYEARFGAGPVAGMLRDEALAAVKASCYPPQVDLMRRAWRRVLAAWRALRGEA
jgi:FkbM family methyltransferase